MSINHLGKDPLIVVGGSARVLAQWAARENWHVIAIDRFGDVDTKKVADWYPAPADWQDLPDYLRQFPQAPIILLGGLENYPEIWRAISVDREVWGPSAMAVAEVRSRHRLPELIAEFLEEGARSPRRCRLRVPQTMGNSSTDRSPEISSKSWLYRESRSSGGGGIFLQKPSEAREGSWVQRVDGRAFGMSFLGGGARSTTVFLGGSVMFRPYVSREGSLWYRGSIGPIDLQRADTVIEFGQWLSKVIDLRGWFGIDVIEDQSGDWWLLEINPRWCASMELIDLAYGKTSPWIQWQRRVCRGEPLGDNVPSVSGKVFAKRILYAKKNLENFDNRDFIHFENHSWFADIPSKGTFIRAGDPLVTRIREFPPRPSSMTAMS